MNMQNVHWEAWQAVRPLGEKVFEMHHSGPNGIETAALKVLRIPAQEGGAAQLLAQGMTPEAVKARLHNRMEATVSAYNLMEALGKHPNVLSCEKPLYDQFEDGFLWQVKVKTQLATPLSQAWPQGMPEEQVLRLGTDIATALALCHEGGLIHEGVKPSNVFALPDGSFCLGDFGAAKASGMPCSGDRSCMSPEVYWGMEYDPKTDVYALGILLYTMLNGGYLPMTWPGMPEDQQRLANENRLSGQSLPAPCSGSAELQQLVLRACAYEPAARFASAVELRSALLQLQGLDGAMPLWPESALMPEALPEQTPTITAAEQPQVAEPQAPQQAPEAAPKKNNSTLYLILAMAAAVLVLGVIGFFTIHIWPDVSCNEIAKCKLCGKTSEEVLSHEWMDATCVEPITCERCGETKGAALGHQLSVATRETPATCSVCGFVQGQALQPSLWVMQIISSGWQGGYQHSVDGATMEISFPQDPGFVGSGLLVSDALRDNVANAFQVTWDKEIAKVTPSAGLAPGVYHLQFSSGDSMAMISICYGYEEDFYLSEKEYFWGDCKWLNFTNDKYLVVTDTDVTTDMQNARATVFVSAFEMVGAQKDGGKLVPTAQDPVQLQSMRYTRAGEEDYTVFAYEGQYLACDEQGNVYFTAELDANCFWMEN